MSKIAKGVWIGAGIAAIGAAAVVSHKITKYMMQVALDRDLPKVKNMEKSSQKMLGEKMNPDIEASLALAKKEFENTPHETVEMICGTGEKLVGHWFPCENAQRTLIAMHGWRSSWAFDFGLISDFWRKNHCNILCVEQRAHNNSDGDYLGFGLLERYDCRDWISWVNDKLGSEVLPIYLCGVSMGATSVLMASGLDLPVNVHGIIADCGFTSPHDIWVHVAKNNLRISSKMRSSVADRICKEKINVGSKSYSTIDALKATKIPVLFIHGSDDHFVPVRMTYENYKACVSPKRLLIVPGAEHGLSYCVDKEQYEAAVYRFWEEFDYRYEKKYFDYKRK